MIRKVENISLAKHRKKNHHYGQNIEPEVHGFYPITDNRIKAKRVFRSQVS